MNDIIHELEAVVAERDALRQQLAEALAKNHWHKDNLSSIASALREIRREFNTKQINLMLVSLLEDVEYYIADSEKLTALSALVEKSKECMALHQEVERLKAENLLLRKQKDAIWYEMAAAQAREQQLREALSDVHDLINASQGVAGLHLNGDVATWEELRTGGRFEEWLCRLDESLAIPADTTALQSMIAKAGEVMRERAISAASAINPIYGSGAAIDAISTVLIVTLDDLKGAAA